MKKIAAFICWGGLPMACVQAQMQGPFAPADWLLFEGKYTATVQKKGDTLELNNGLLRRSFVLTPGLACTDFTNLASGQQLLRSLSPEARVTINGQTYAAGGYSGLKEKAFFKPEWLSSLQPQTAGFVFSHYTTTPIQPEVNWQATGWWMGQALPATGIQVQLHFIAANPHVKGLQLVVHYQLYSHLPLLAKWITLQNKDNAANYRLDTVVHEIIAMVEEESAVVGAPEQMAKPQGIYFETNYSFNNAMRYTLSDQTLHWKTDRSYTSQVNYNYETPCVVEIYPDKAPGITLKPGETFTSVKTWELLHDSYDRERRGLAVRKMYRTIAPWTVANPIFMHLVSKNDDEVTEAVNQCAATGYEAVILSFGSHINMEDTSAANLLRWQKLATYAHNRGIKIGGYSLFSSRRIDDANDVVNPKTGKTGGAFFGNAPCFGSAWGLAYAQKIKTFFAATGFDIWENDGPYPGDLCASTTHPGHEGLHDSQWKQMAMQKELYRWLNERGVYINAPDWYFLDGTHKIAIGYREVNFSLSRQQQKVLNRQNIFDGTWEKTPAMGWGFVPLTHYQGGGPDAILEPLSEHLADYRQLMMQYYGAGVQACYRGPRLYDTDTTRKVVTEVIDWYKKHRDILNSDLIHLRRADGRDWDGWLHLNPQLPEKGLLMLFNPLPYPIKRTLKLPLYYGGLRQKATLNWMDGLQQTVALHTDRQIATLEVLLPANGYTWAVIR